MIGVFDQLDLPDSAGHTLRRPAGLLTLHRAWTRSEDHLLLEFLDAGQQLLPGQWFRDANRAEEVATKTKRHTNGQSVALLAGVNGLPGAVVLQADGADRRLSPLRPLLDQPGTTLVSHRPERRAVVRWDDAGRTQYAKVHRPGLPSTAHNLTVALWQRMGADEPSGVTRSIAPLVPDRCADGVVVHEALEGPTLLERIDDHLAYVEAAKAAGQLLRSLHETPSAHVAEVELPVHRGESEAQLLISRHQRLVPFDPDVAERVAAAVDIFGGLLAASEPRLVLAHRDFYDKQLIVRDGGPLGLLDLDTVGWAAPESDVANFLVHVELRGAQGRCSTGTVDAATHAFLDGYGRVGLNAEEVDLYRNATRLRLACLYALRPAWIGLPELLLQGVPTSV